jgi:hypothetical protein
MDEQKQRIKADPQLRGIAQSAIALLIGALWLATSSRPERAWVITQIQICCILTSIAMIIRWVLRYSELSRSPFLLSPGVKIVLKIGSGAAMIGSLLFMMYLFATNSRW